MTQKLNELLMNDGFQLAFSFTPRNYSLSFVPTNRTQSENVGTIGEAQHILGNLGQEIDNKSYSGVREFRVIGITDAFPNEEFDDRVKDRFLIYVKAKD